MNLTRKNIKFKYLTFSDLSISIDRLSRFKLPEESFYRVFSNIIEKCLIYPKYSKSEIENLSGEDLSYLVSTIWNKSVENLYEKKQKKKQINLLKFLVNETFIVSDEKTKKLINTELRITEILDNLDYEKSPINIKFLIKTKEAKTKNEILEITKKHNLLFPIRKLIIVEGITEEILLPVFAEKTNYSFNKNGVYILGAGGKSKSPSLYLQLKNKLKIPILLLFDNDAEEICNLLNKNLNKIDKTFLIQNGEFEDILSLNLIKRSLNKEYEPATPLLKEELRLTDKMTECIELFYRTRHLGEFKKSKVSKIISQNIKYETDLTEEIKEIITFVANL